MSYLAPLRVDKGSKVEPVTQDDIDDQATALLGGVPEGNALDELQVTLLRFALSASATSLDTDGAREHSLAARRAGATSEQLQEIVTLISSIGVHAFFESTRLLAAQGGAPEDRGAFDEQRQGLWDRHIGARKYWTSMREEIPGFLEALLWLSPEAFDAFIEYVGLPFRSRHVDTLTKEIISMAADAATSHRYLPGMRMHLRNAVHMGAGRRAIEQALRIAAASPAAVGVR